MNFTELRDEHSVEAITGNNMITKFNTIIQFRLNTI
jgi:hypothetical protein